MIIRPDYINAITPFIDIPLVKILAGVRRSGKSTILEMLKEEFLKRGINENRIISRNYSSSEYDNGLSSKEMYEDLKSCIIGNERYYLFLDELQEVDGWEKAVNTLMENENTDIYVTGSNSKLMSSEIETYLSGRYISIPVYTLSFKEYLMFKNADTGNAREIFNDYIQYGGFPIIAISELDTRSAYQIAEGIYAAVITRGISKRHRIRNKALFDRVVKFIIENVGKTFSANSIVKFLKSEKRSLSVETIYNYINWLTEAFIIYPCNRYDIRGKSVLKTQEKYYLSDISFKYSQMGFDNSFVSAMLENIVFLEMKRRGYDVYVGKNETREIDFAGMRRGDRIYVQVCRNLPAESVRETANLAEIKDHYHKYVVALDPLAAGNENGIRFVHIADFLLMDEW